MSSNLTEAGRNEVEDLVTVLHTSGVRPTSIFYVDRTQCFETACIVRDRFENPVLVKLELEPFNLGVLTGLSDDECREQYPLLAERMSQYRRGDLEIADVNIPGASDPEEFFRTAKITTESLRLGLGQGDIVVIGTRSVLVGLLNVALSRSPISGGGYREIPWANCGYCILSSSLELEALNGVVV